MRSSLAMVILGAGCGLAVACGSPGSVDFYVASVGSAAAGGQAGSASPAGAAGAGANAGQSAHAGGGGLTGPNDAPCSPVQEGMNMMSGAFGTSGPYCLRVSEDIAGWGCSNFEGRTIKVNGTTLVCGQLPLPDKLHGAYYFDISAGMYEYASFYWFK